MNPHREKGALINQTFNKEQRTNNNERQREKQRKEKKSGREDKGETLLIKRLQRVMTLTWHFNFYYVIAMKKKAPVCASVFMCVCAQTDCKQHFSSPVICWECITHYFSLTWCKAKTNSQRQARTHTDLRSHTAGTMMRHSAMVRTLVGDWGCVCVPQGLNNTGLVVLENTQTQDHWARANYRTNTDDGGLREEVARLWGETVRVMDR